MKRFMAVFTGSPNAFENYAKRFPNEEARKANDRKGIEAWHKWVEQHAASIVDGGGPLGKTKRASKDGIADARNNLAGYTLIQAESQEAAAKLFLNHPHFAIFPGVAVEILEVMPIPERP